MCKRPAAVLGGGHLSQKRRKSEPKEEEKHSHSLGGVPVGRIFLFVRRLKKLQIPTFCLSCSLPAKVGIPQQVELPLKDAENVISRLICLRSIWSRKLTPLKIRFQWGSVLGPNCSESYWAGFGEFVCYYFLAKTGNFFPFFFFFFVLTLCQ